MALSKSNSSIPEMIWSRPDNEILSQRWDRWLSDMGLEIKLEPIKGLILDKDGDVIQVVPPDVVCLHRSSILVHGEHFNGFHLFVYRCTSFCGRLFSEQVSTFDVRKYGVHPTAEYPLILLLNAKQGLI